MPKQLANLLLSGSLGNPFKDDASVNDVDLFFTSINSSKLPKLLPPKGSIKRWYELVSLHTCAFHIETDLLMNIAPTLLSTYRWRHLSSRYLATSGPAILSCYPAPRHLRTVLRARICTPLLPASKIMSASKTNAHATS